MKTSGLIFFLSLQLLRPTGSVVLWPKKILGSWTSASVESLKCVGPSDGDLSLTPDTKTFLIEAKFPRLKKQDFEEGFWCTKVRSWSSCEFTWYFQHYYESGVEYLEPLEDECWRAHKLMKRNRLDTPMIPSPQCFYGEKVVTEQVTHLLREENIPFDPFKDIAVDHRLEHGFCSERFCRSQSGASVWLSPHTPSLSDCETSEDFVPMTAVLSEEEKFLGVSSPEQGWLSSKDLCSTTVCGEKGLKTSRGVFFIPRRSLSSLLGLELLSSPPCRDGSLPKYQSPTFLEESHLYFSMQLVREQLCYMKLEILRLGGKLSVKDIHLFVPASPQIGPIFRISQGRLLATSAVYRALNPSEITSLKGRINPNEHPLLKMFNTSGVSVSENDTLFNSIMLREDKIQWSANHFDSYIGVLGEEVGSPLPSVTVPHILSQREMGGNHSYYLGSWDFASKEDSHFSVYLIIVFSGVSCVIALFLCFCICVFRSRRRRVTSHSLRINSHAMIPLRNL